MTSVKSLSFVSFADLWPVMTPAHAKPAPSTPAPPLGCVCYHVKAMWAHTNNQPLPTPDTHTHLESPSVGRQPVTLDISMVEVRPRADWPAVEVPHSCVSVWDMSRWVGVPVQYYKDNKTMVNAAVGHNERTQHKHCCRKWEQTARSKYGEPGTLKFTWHHQELYNFFVQQ